MEIKILRRITPSTRRLHRFIPKFRQRTLFFSTVALFFITLFGGFIFKELELERELRDARHARVAPFDTFRRILPGLRPEDKEFVLDELYQGSTAVDLAMQMKAMRSQSTELLVVFARSRVVSCRRSAALSVTGVVSSSVAIANTSNVIPLRLGLFFLLAG